MVTTPFQFKVAKKAVKESPYKVSWIAKQLDIQYQTLVSYLNGWGYPSREKIAKLAKLLDRPLSDFWKE